VSVLLAVDQGAAPVSSPIERRRSGVCPDCDAPAVVPTADRGERVCEECGLVVADDEIDRGPEWRAYSHRESQAKSRVGAPATRTLHDKGLTTDIDWRDEDAAGTPLSDRQRERVSRLRQWHERVRTNEAGERSLRYALGEIDRMAAALGVPRPVREVASTLYRRALAEDLVRGRSTEAVTTAVLYAACRVEGVTRSLDEVAAVARVERTPVGRTYRYLAGELALELEPVDPAEYIPRFRSELGLSERVGRTASEVVGRTVASGVLSGKSPTGFAAGAIYVAALLCDEKRTQAAVADAAGVTTVTVRNRYQAQIDALGISAGDGLSEGSRASLDAEGSPASSTPVVATETPPSSPSPPSPSSNDWRDSGGDSDDRDDDGSSGRDSDGSEDNDESNESDDSDEHRLSKP